MIIPAQVTYNSITYNVTSIGNYAFSGCSSLTSITIPESVTSIGYSAFDGCTGFTTAGPIGGGYDFEFGWTESIPATAFRGCASLTSVTIPGSVTSIGSEAFSGCSGLTSAGPIGGGYDYEFGWTESIPAYAFRGCTGLTSVTIPGSVTSIGAYAFYQCFSLTLVTIPEGVTSIGDYAFCECSALTSVTIPEGVTSIGDYAFFRCASLTALTIPESVTSIGNHAFSGCTGLSSVTIPEGVTSIGDDAFDGCTGLTSVTIPEGVTSIGDGAFSFCSGLTSVTIPGSVTSIGSGAFWSCSGLTSVTIPEGVTSIGDYAFSYCTGLTLVTIPESVTNIGYQTFLCCENVEKLIWNSNVSPYVVTQYCKDKLVSVTVGNNVTSIGSNAFSGCTGLTSAGPIGGGYDYEFGWTESIPAYAFSSCSSLTSVTIPGSVTSIGSNAFSGCTGLTSAGPIGGGYDCEFGWTESIPAVAFSSCSSLTSVTIPKGVTTIGVQAFYNCTSLTSVTIPESVTSIGFMAFYGCSGLSSAGPIGGGYTYEFGWTESIPDNAFYGCSSLTFVTIPEGVTSIGSSAFSGCSGLTSVTIPEGVTSISNYAFSNCSSLTSLTIPEGVTSIGSSAFRGCSGLTSVTIPKAVTSIGDYAFYGCSSLTSLTIPEGVTSIGSSAFDGCSSLTSVAIPESVTSIGDGAFNGCSGITTMTIPENVTSIGGNTLMNCSSLTLITCLSNRPPIATYDIVSNYSKVTLRVPKEALNTYYAHSIWGKFVNIVGFDPTSTLTLNASVGGSVSGAGSFDTGSDVTATAVPNYGFVFLGWYDGEELVSSKASYTFTLEESIALTAVFEKDANIFAARYKASAGGDWTALAPVNGRLDISDTFYAFEVTAEETVDEVAYSRTFGTEKWQSLYLPFDVAVADFEGKFDVAYVNNFVQYADDDGMVDHSSIEIMQVRKGVLFANTPYFIRAHQTSESPQVITFHNVTLKPTASGEVSHVESAVSKADFYGTYTTIDKSVTTGDHLFIVSGGDFKWLNQNVKCFRTYMKLTAKNPMFYIESEETISIRVFGEDDATNINVNENEDEDENAVVYDLQGRRVDTPQQGGIYIVNGRKTFIR